MIKLDNKLYIQNKSLLTDDSCCNFCALEKNTIEICTLFCPGQGYILKEVLVSDIIKEILL